MTDTERLEATRVVRATPDEVFALLCDPDGHVAIDASGMLQSAEGDPVTAAGDSFVVHMNRDSLGDLPDWHDYDVTVQVRTFEAGRELAWTILGRLRPQIGHVYGYRLEAVEPADDAAPATRVTSYYDWSEIDEHWRGRLPFPVIDEKALRATLGILERTVRRGYPRPARDG